jgi:hypothetical protein
MEENNKNQANELEKIWERIDNNFNNLVSLIGEIVEELKNKGG